RSPPRSARVSGPRRNRPPPVSSGVTKAKETFGQADRGVPRPAPNARRGPGIRAPPAWHTPRPPPPLSPTDFATALTLLLLYPYAPLRNGFHSIPPQPTPVRRMRRNAINCDVMRHIATKCDALRRNFPSPPRSTTPMHPPFPHPSNPDPATP